MNDFLICQRDLKISIKFGYWAKINYYTWTNYITRRNNKIIKWLIITLTGLILSSQYYCYLHSH